MSSLPIDDDSRAAIAAAARIAQRYLDTLPDRPVREPDIMDAVGAFDEALPDEGEGAIDTLDHLGEHGIRSAAHSAGPRFFHFVVGGVTPAALGADWLASALDQNAFAWLSSPLGSEVERVAVRWLAELFELPAGHAGC